MTLRVLDDRALILLSVRDLVPADPAERFRAGGGEGWLSMRLAAGAAIHREIAREHADLAPGFRREVTVRYERAVDGYTLRVHGRIDGVHAHESGAPLVEEVKTVAALEVDASRLAAFRDQALIYAFLLDHERGFPPDAPVVRARLLLVERRRRERRVIDLDYDRAAVEAIVAERLRALVAAAVADRARRARRASDALRLRFPFERTRAQQDALVVAVAEAIAAAKHLLVSAPAGLGKTAASLFPAVRHALETGRRVFFATAKTLQAENARRVLEAFRDQGVDLRAVVLRAKEKVCLNDVVVCREDRCAHARDYGKKLVLSGALATLPAAGVVTADRVMEAGHRHEICPFELSLDLTDRADVVVGDYNYVFDPRVALRHLFENEGDSILVIDEAHNLPARAAEYYSPALFRKKGRSLLRALPAGPEALRKRTRKLLRAIDALIAAAEAEATGGPLFEAAPSGHGVRARIEIDPAPFTALRADAEAVLVEWIALFAETRRTEPDDPLVDALFEFLRFEEVLSIGGAEFTHFFGEDEGGDAGSFVKILCKDASRFLAERMESFRSVIAMSATLKPFEFYRDLLGLEPARTLEAEFASPFPAANRRVVVVPEVSTLFRDRDRSAPRIAAIVGEAVRLRAGNYVAFFPSFDFMRKVGSRLDRSGIEVLEQREGTSEREREALLEALATEAIVPRLFLAVQGGVFAEGVDFAGDLCVGVFVVGPALPKVGFEREEMRRHFEERYGRGFEYAYLYPGMARVVQAAGRLIRSETDHGIVMLLCRRFAQRAYAELFPRDWYARSPGELVVRDWRGEIERFWRSRGAAPRAKRAGYLF